MNAANIEKTIAAGFGKQQNPPTKWKKFLNHANLIAEEGKKEPLQESLARILTDPEFKSVMIAVQTEVFECNLTLLISSCRVFRQISIPDNRKIILPADRFSAEGFRAFYKYLTGVENIIPGHDLLLDAMAVSEGLGAYSTFSNIYQLRDFDSFWRGRTSPLCKYAKVNDDTWKLSMTAFLEYLGKPLQPGSKTAVENMKSEMDIADNGMTEGEQGLPEADI